MGYEARLGDIRHNFMAYWPHASRARYGGIGKWGGDPLTGQIHGASAMTMGRSATRAAAYQRDLIQVVLGDLSIEEITNGTPAYNYAQTLKNGRHRGALTTEELNERVASVDAEHAHMATLPKVASGSVAEQYGAMMEMHKNTTPDVDWLASADAQFDAVAGKVRGTLEEAQLVDGQWMTSVAGLAPWTDAEGGVLDGVSPLRGMDPGALRAGQHRVQQMLHARGLCFGHNEAPVGGHASLTGLAKYFGDKYPASEYDAKTRGELIYQDLWKESFKGIALHEVGHSLGLLHNFASSWDSVNFHPGYWQLRTHEGQSQASCAGVPRNGDTESVEGDNCMGPRYLDPKTLDEQGLDAESRPDILYFGQTTTMEYSLNRFGETMGLGQYDAHAMKALYGRVLETFDDADRGGLTPDEQWSMAPRLESQLGEQDRVVRSDAPFEGQTFAKPTHYTEVGRRVRVFDPSRCREATAEEKVKAEWRLVHGKVCAPAPRDHARWEDFQHGQAQPNAPFDTTAPWLSTKADTGTGGKQGALGLPLRRLLLTVVPPHHDR